eukprot:TRINITY_DN17412_c0_g1_i3.p1 TRINITY_DN17412_c0_g1~~TRINITY_DN17412_c0_g1_i3.p1  ORF type:complete len:598 (+),score=69.32 TRINITY_DN17412_c0_g1_i3:154-1947(+)
MATMLDVRLETYGVWLAIGITMGCLAIYITVVARIALALLPQSNLRASATSALRTVLQRVRDYCSASRKNDAAFERKVRHLAEEARLKWARHLMRALVHVTAAASLSLFVFSDYLDLPRFKDTELARWELHQGILVSVCLYFSIAMYGWLVPDRTTVLALHVFHVLVVGRVCCQFWMADSVYQVLGLGLRSTGERLGAALVLGTPTMTFCLNGACALVQAWKFSSLFADLSMVEQDIVLSVSGDLQTVVLRQVLLCGSAWCFTLVIERVNYAVVRANLQARTSSTSAETVKSILAVLCDAVVAVDANLFFNAPNTQLMQFLLRRPLQSNREGASLLDVLEASDRDRVRQQITTSFIGHGTTLSLAAKLIDGNDSAVKVQMYCTCFIDINDCRAYVIGILEVKDPDHLDARGDTLALDDLAEIPEDASVTPPGTRGSGELHAASEFDRVSLRSASLSNESVVVPVATNSEDFEIWVDIADDRIPVLEASGAMTHLAGPVCRGDVSFLDWLRPSEVDDVVAFIEQAFDNFSAQPGSHRLSASESYHAALPGHRALACFKTATDTSLGTEFAREQAIDRSIHRANKRIKEPNEGSCHQTF